jgi:Flp pilus assembly pilin Flp
MKRIGIIPQALKRIFMELWSDEGGQAIVEYLLMVGLVVVSMALIFGRIRGTLFSFWRMIVREVRGPCVGCTPSGDGP